MIAALIFVISLAALLQFFVLHCRSMLAYSRRIQLSNHILEVTGMTGQDVAAGDFDRLVQLVHLCPERGDDQKQIRVVGLYYALLNMVGRMTRRVVPSVAQWVENERRGCSYFAAVALDRRISYSRDLFSQQVANHT
ncbi:MAG TPA: hypothetical protein VKS44_15315 [Candidatus Acidoferrales bacterium]|nr:hypothetical protein [Candidatus Acidoferrales bacterium]